MVCVYTPNWLVGTTKLVFYLLIICILTLFSVLLGMRTIIKRDWPKYRCNPLILPFAGLFGYDPSKTFTQCLASNIDEATGPVVKPYDDLFGVLKSTAGNMSNSLSDMRDVMNNMKDSVTDGFGVVANKMGNAGATAKFLMYKVQGIFQKLLALYVVLLYFAWSMMKGLEAMVNDPNIKKAQRMTDKAMKFIDNPGKAFKDLGKDIGKGAKKAGKKIKKAFSCFAPTARVLLENGKFKDMIDVVIGDKLMGGGIVTGTMTFSGDNNALVNNKGIISTFDHHVLYNERFIKSGHVPGCKPVSRTVPYLYDLDTSNHRIIIMNDDNEYITYTDYTEVDDESGTIYNYELSLLNKDLKPQKNNLYKNWFFGL